MIDPELSQSKANSACALTQAQADARALRLENARLRARLEELERLADSDPLTPVPNRRVFLRELERVLRQAERYGTPAAVMFVDVDNLKHVNDLHGHPVGDATLIHVASMLRRELRATDTVARIGGDEFGLILDHLPESAIGQKAITLAAMIGAHPLRLAEATVPVSISIGYAMIRPGDTVEALMGRADAAMYATKTARDNHAQMGLPLSRN